MCNHSEETHDPPLSYGSGMAALLFGRTLPAGSTARGSCLLSDCVGLVVLIDVRLTPDSPARDILMRSGSRMIKSCEDLDEAVAEYLEHRRFPNTVECFRSEMRHRRLLRYPSAQEFHVFQQSSSTGYFSCSVL